MGSTGSKRRSGARPTAVLGSRWVDEACDLIPSVAEQVEQGIALARAEGLTEDGARAEFGRWLVHTHRAVERVYRTAAEEAVARLVTRWVESAGSPPISGEFKSWLRDLMARAGADFIAFEFRAGQSRKSRAGSVWERLGHRFLDWNGIPNAKPSGKKARMLRQIDRVVPDVETAIHSEDRAARLSFKTEAREKWRVLIDEGRHGHVYLVTLGDDVTTDRLKEMSDSRLVVYVPDAIKNSSPEFAASDALRPLDQLIEDLRRYVPRGPKRPPDQMISLREVRAATDES